MHDISWLELSSAYALFLVPLLIIFILTRELLKPALVAIARMSIQLSLVGIYLKYVFKLDHLLVNLIWVLLMIAVASVSITRRSDMRRKEIFIPVFFSLLPAAAVSAAYALLVVIGLPDAATARFIIPITGMVLGNCLNGTIICLRTFFQALKDREETYLFYIAAGAERSAALRPFKKEAMKNAYSPAIATMATIGIVSLPGMMTGQILGGSTPVMAIRYQILIMVAIFTSVILAVYMALTLVQYTAFNRCDLLKENL